MEPDSRSRLHLGIKLRDRLEKLARWRIDPAQIGFPENGPEFRGGNATVSRALLTLPSDIQRIGDKSEYTSDQRPVPDGRNPDSHPDTRELGDKERGVHASQDAHPDGVEGPRPNKEEGKDSDDDSAVPNPQPSKSKDVAVKKLKIEKDADVERVLGLALREAEFVLDLSHRNIMKIEGYVEDAPKQMIWLVFPWEENGNLRDFLVSGEWEIPERISLISDVANGVKYLHSRKPSVYHGDLKSLNVLVNSNYRAVITDFGSARRLEHEAPKGKTKENETKPQSGPDPTTGEDNTPLQAVFCATTNTITLTGSKYTLRWAAPELLSEDRPTLASDIWALGWIAYEVMTDSIPFHDVKKDTMVVKRVIQGDLPSITDHARMSLIRALCSLMAQCWHGNPIQRPTADDCTKSLNWMPRMVPAPTRTIDSEASQIRYAKLLLKLGDMYLKQDDYGNALNCYNKSLDNYQNAGNSEGRADALYGLADVHSFQGEHSEAAKLFSEALHIYVDIGAPRAGSRARTLWALAETYRLESDEDNAVKFYSESLQIYTDLGHRQGRAYALRGLAEVHQSRSQYTEATALYSEALEIHNEIGDIRGKAENLWNFAEIHRARHEYDKAIKFYSESLQISTDLGDRNWRASNLSSLADVYWLQGECSIAISFYTEALQACSDIGDKRGRADALWNLAAVHYEQDHDGAAIDFYTGASKAYDEIGDSFEATNALKEAADIRTKVEGSA